jgi:hypothetical protein
MGHTGRVRSRAGGATATAQGGIDQLQSPHAAWQIQQQQHATDRSACVRTYATDHVRAYVRTPALGTQLIMRACVRHES